MRKRAVYAAAMGIDYWFARQALSNAPANHFVLLPDAVPDTTVIDHPSNRHPASSGQAEALASFSSNPVAELERRFNDKRSPANTVAQQEQQPTKPDSQRAAGHSSAQATVLEFELVAFVHHHILIVDEVTHLSFTNSAYQDWMNAILISIGHPRLEASFVSGDRLQWPAADLQYAVPGYQSEAGQNRAVDMVSAWLERKVQEASCEIKQVLSLGAITGQLLLPRSGDLCCAVGAWPMLCCPGTAELWSNPEKKRDLWGKLQSLSA